MNKSKSTLSDQMKTLNVEFRKKGEDPWRGWHKIVPIFFFIVGIFSRSSKRQFYRMWTVLNNIIYCPDPERVLSNLNHYTGIIRHEMVHIMDDMAHPVKFKLGYVLSRKRRAFYEYRGYTQDMIFEFQRTGEVSDRTIERLARLFRGPAYFWMHRKPMPVLEAIRDAITSGKVVGFENEPLNTIIKENM